MKVQKWNEDWGGAESERRADGPEMRYCQHQK